MATSHADRYEGLRELLGELIDAHIDTIEMLVGRGDRAARAAHLDYVQGLVRYSKRFTADHPSEPKTR
jgi:hypothetical protein